MTTAAEIPEDWARALNKLGESPLVADKLNAALARSVPKSLASKLRLGLSEGKLLFVPRGVVGRGNSFVLAGFMSADTYSMALVVDLAVKRRDLCSGAIRTPVLVGFLRDLVKATQVAEPEVEATAETIEGAKEGETGESSGASELAGADGWMRPGDN